MFSNFRIIYEIGSFQNIHSCNIYLFIKFFVINLAINQFVININLLQIDKNQMHEKKYNTSCKNWKNYGKQMATRRR